MHSRLCIVVAVVVTNSAPMKTNKEPYIEDQLSVCPFCSQMPLNKNDETLFVL